MLWQVSQDMFPGGPICIINYGDLVVGWHIDYRNWVQKGRHVVESISQSQDGDFLESQRIMNIRY